MATKKAKFSVGQIVYHRLFDYRGVIVDVDANYQSNEAYYDMMTQSKPLKEKPWYYILVDDADYSTYVSEQNLEKDKSGDPISHPALEAFFTVLKNGFYLPKRLSN